MQIAGQWVHPNDISNILGEPDFCWQLQHFIQDQLQDSSPESDTASSSSMLPALPTKITTYASAVATFYAPSNISGIGGMCSERICAVDTWCHGNGQNDCMFINTDPTQPSMCGLDVACARLLFSFVHEWVKYSCAFVKWFSQIRDCANENMGMWSVKLEIFKDGMPNSSIIHLDSVVWLAHLLPIYHDMWVPSGHWLNFTWSLDTFTTFYVNKYIDHHAFENCFLISINLCFILFFWFLSYGQFLTSFISGA